VSVVIHNLERSTQGHSDIINISNAVTEIITDARLWTGTVTVSVMGSTAALSTCEYEPGLVQDLKDWLNTHMPPGSYHHDAAWGDGNGHSHLRATLIGPSVTLPVDQGEMLVGTWQQIILIDCDTRPRQRRLNVVLMGNFQDTR
jgi:secondary thiamine-phosphate synthase enzyme